MISIFIIFLTILYILSLLKCKRLSDENMKLHMENMAIHELYLNRTKCQCQKTDSDRVEEVNVLHNPPEPGGLYPKRSNSQSPGHHKKE